MERIDKDQAARVWERVRAADPGEMNPEALVLESWSLATGFLQLSRRLPGQRGAQLHSLYKMAQQCTDCLKGLCLLVNGKRPALGSNACRTEPVESALRSLYGGAMRLLAKLEGWSSHSQYGPVFARLSQLERDQCRQILCLLGSLDSGGKG